VLAAVLEAVVEPMVARLGGKHSLWQAAFPRCLDQWFHSFLCVVSNQHTHSGLDCTRIALCNSAFLLDIIHQLARPGGRADGT
jgi:hypothetical protein